MSILADGHFVSFQDWVNKAASRLAGRDARCFDTEHRELFGGSDFERAREDEAFPVRYYFNCGSPYDDEEYPTP